MQQYKDLLKHVLIHGRKKGDRTGTGTLQVFGYQNRYNLNAGLPVVTTKRVPLKLVIGELLWFLEGSTDNKRLAELSQLQVGQDTIWEEWVGKGADGHLGPIYGHQWRSWHVGYKAGEHGHVEEVTIDQIANVVDEIKHNSNSRRHIVSAWNPTDIPDMALAPCHCLFQFDVTDGELSCQLYQRSCDAFLGAGFNITSYSLLTYMIAHVCNLKVGTFVHTFGDLHIYNNHMEQVKEVLRRDTRPLPQLKFARKVDSIFDFKSEDFIIEGYNPHPTIKAEVAV